MTFNELRALFELPRLEPTSSGRQPSQSMSAPCARTAWALCRSRGGSNMRCAGSAIWRATSTLPPEASAPIPMGWIARRFRSPYHFRTQ